MRNWDQRNDRPSLTTLSLSFYREDEKTPPERGLRKYF